MPVLKWLRYDIGRQSKESQINGAWGPYYWTAYQLCEPILSELGFLYLAGQSFQVDMVITEKGRLTDRAPRSAT